MKILVESRPTNNECVEPGSLEHDLLFPTFPAAFDTIGFDMLKER